MHESSSLAIGAITSAMSARVEFEIHDTLPSTNERALARVREGRRTPLVIMADRQTAGRGRQGRHWQSQTGNAFCLSLLWPFRGGTRLDGLSLVVGAVLAEVLQRMGLPKVQLKWPNDIYVDHRKLGGILIELASNLTEQPVAVIGVGINGYLDDKVKREIDQPVTDWYTETGLELGRNQLAALLVDQLAIDLPAFGVAGFAPFRERWQARDICIGQRVWLSQGGERQEVQVMDVADDGSLVVAREQHVWQVYGGEVSVRMQRNDSK